MTFTSLNPKVGAGEMTQEDTTGNGTSTNTTGNATSTNTTGNATSADTTARSIKSELFDWLTNNFLLAVAPLIVSYLALTSRNPLTIFERGDAFIITAALLAPEIALLRNLGPAAVTDNLKNLRNVMYFLVLLYTILFVASTSDYNTTHPEIAISNMTGIKGSRSVTAVLGNKANASPPFPNLTPIVIDILSIPALLVTIILIYYSIRGRQRIGGAS